MVFNSLLHRLRPRFGKPVFAKARSRKLVVCRRCSVNIALVIEALEDRYLPSFLPPVSYPASVYDLAVGDLDKDGILDLVSNGSVLLGNGDGSFQAPISWPAGPNSYDVALGDFNGDGIPDLVVTHAFSNTVSILLGNGNGSFQDPVSFDVV